MKKSILFFVFLSAIFASCSKTPEQKAQQSVKDYLQKNLNDAKSYESVEFSNFRSDSTSYYDTAKDDVFDSIRSKYESDSLFRDINVDYQNTFIETKKRYEAAEIQHNSNVSKFKPEFKGYIINHKYRAKNKMGAVVLDENCFIMDKNFVVIKAL
jgi:hypothetical protein